MMWTDLAMDLISAADSGRLARSMEISSGAVRVIDRAESPARVRALVRGSAPAPYRVTLAVTGRASCTCPDRAAVCKHALALLAALVEEERTRAA